MNIMLLFDVPFAVSADLNPLDLLLHDPQYRDERDVYRALQRLGEDVFLFPIYDDVAGMLAFARAKHIDLAFVLAETLANDRGGAVSLQRELELAGIATTTSASKALFIAADKGLSKESIRAAGLLTPDYLVMDDCKNLDALDKMKYPVIVKPCCHEGSEGISLNSICASPEKAKERVRFLFAKNLCPAIVEEFIYGHDLYVGILATGEDVRVFKPVELRFGSSQIRATGIATSRVKWDSAYRKRHGIRYMRAIKREAADQKKLEETARRAAAALALEGYARFDFRITPDGDLYFIEANPSPSISRGDEFALGAASAGMEYDQLIQSIVQSGLMKNAA